MSATWKTVRVFISSTFRDMQAERDHLVRFVFPKLRQELLQRRIHLVDVDLRWGVTSEQDALSVCREVVDECRPRFLCILGGRYGWVPSGKTRSITADEVHYGVLDRDLRSRGFAYFYFRDPSATAAMVEVTPGEFREPVGSQGAVALAELKTAIIEAGLQPFIYRAQWDDQSRRLIGLKEFGDRVYEDLRQSIDQEFGPATGEKPDEFTEENAAMEAFIEERVQRFVLGSRQPVWNELRQHAESTGGNGYLCLTGAAGSGKSALLARFYRTLTSSPQRSAETAKPLVPFAPFGGQPALVICHFVGASPGSTDVRRTLRRLCHELVTGAGLTAEIPEDLEKLRVAFAEILQQASAQKRVVILLDAINQFDPTTQLAGWSWLPEELPATARILLSTLSVISDQSSVVGDHSPQSTVHSPLDALRHRRNPPREIALEPLTIEDAEGIIREFLHRYRKSMTDNQRAALLAKADAGTPLYLLVALEELRTLGTYEEITARIAQLPPDTRALFIWILKRLEKDDGFRDASGGKIGRELVARFVSLMGASRHGLSQQELVELLSPGDPQGNAAALAQLLRPYLMQRGELLDFFHGQFREAAATSYLPSESLRLAAHDQLATYFRDKADPKKNQTWEGGNPRPFLELPWHLHNAGQDAELRTLLLDFTWLQAKLATTDVAALVADYDHLPEEEHLRVVQGAIRLSAHAVGPDKSQLAGQLVGRLAGGKSSDIRELVMVAGDWKVAAWLKPTNGNLHHPDEELLRTLTGHTDSVNAVAVSPDGRLVVSGSWDTTLKVWELGSGRELRTLTGHTDSVNAVAVSPDGRLVVSGSSDTTLKVWELESGRELRTLTGHTDSVNAVAVSPDGRLVVSGSSDTTLKVWELESGRELRTLKGHGNIVKAVALSPEGRLAVSLSNDETLKLWELSSGLELETLSEHYLPWGHLSAVATIADGWLAVSASGQRAEQSVTVIALAGCPDGRLALSASDAGFDLKVWGQELLRAKRIVRSRESHDVNFRVWTLESGRERRTLQGHSNTVMGLVVSPDGRLAISASLDTTLKVWNLSSTRKRRDLEGDAHIVRCVAFTPDGRLAVSVSEHLNRRASVWALGVSELGSGRARRILERPPPRKPTTEVERLNQMLHPDWWAVGHRKPRKLWPIPRDGSVHILDGYRFFVTAVATSSDGRQAVTASSDRTLRVWELETGRHPRALKGHSRIVNAVAVSPDGRTAVSASADKALKVWELESGRELRTLMGHTDAVRAVAVSPDGRLVVSGSSDTTLKVWELESGRELRTLKGHGKSVTDVLMSPDGLRAVSASLDKTLKVWDLSSGCELRTLMGHCGRRAVLALSPDGRLVVAASADQTVKVWDLESGRLLATFTAESELCGCAISPDCHTIVAVEQSTRLHFLRLVLPDDPVD